MTSNALIRHLSGYSRLGDVETALLDAACKNVREFPAGHHLIREGDAPDPVFVMLDGWACGYKILPDGGRQIISFLLPGDFCDVHIAILQAIDHNIMTLTKARVASLPRAEMEVLIQANANLTQAFWWSQLVDQSILRSWIASMGRRKSVERVAHLMCELYIRMRNIGLASDDECKMPLTQLVLADALGLTPVHVNRVLRELKEAEVMELSQGSLKIIDSSKLAEIAGFDGNYLHERIQQYG